MTFPLHNALASFPVHYVLTSFPVHSVFASFPVRYVLTSFPVHSGILLSNFGPNLPCKYKISTQEYTPTYREISAVFHFSREDRSQTFPILVLSIVPPKPWLGTPLSPYKLFGPTGREGSSRKTWRGAVFTTMVIAYYSTILVVRQFPCSCTADKN